jgi:hypothetical protein
LAESIKSRLCKNTEIKILTRQGPRESSESCFFGGFSTFYERSRKIQPTNRSESVTYRSAPIPPFGVGMKQAQKEPAGDHAGGFFWDHQLS